MTGVFVARDLLLFALFWDLMLIPVFLVLIGAPSAWRYLVYNATGGLALLLATAAFGIVGGSTDILGQAPSPAAPLGGLRAVDLRRFRARVLGEDAGLAAAHLDAGYVHRPAAAGRRGRRGGPIEGRTLRLHRHRADRLLGSDARGGAADVHARPHRSALRRADRARAERRQTDRRLLVALASRVDPARDLQFRSDRARRSNGLHRRARAVQRRALPRAGPSRNARRDALAHAARRPRGADAARSPAAYASRRWRRSGCPGSPVSPARSSSSPDSIAAAMRGRRSSR